MDHMPEKPQKPGPEEERLKIDAHDGWEKAVDKALKKPKPKEGWPDPPDPSKPKEDAKETPSE